VIHGLDTSILVAVEVSSHEKHASARSRFQKLLKAQDAFALGPRFLRSSCTW
jgi:predicted nucleic acid-binding protein